MIGTHEIETSGGRISLALSFNAMCAIEQESKRTFADVLGHMNSGSISDIRLVFWASMRSAKPGVTLDEAGNVIDEIGFGEVMKALTEVISASGLIEKDAPAKNPKARPTKAG